MIDHTEHSSSARATLMYMREHDGSVEAYRDRIWIARDREHGPVNPSGKGWPLRRLMGLSKDEMTEGYRDALSAVCNILDAPRLKTGTGG
jgi:hypothetical protein